MQSNTKFDPNVHSSIVSNYRAQWEERYKVLLILSDKEIFNIWRDHLIEDDGLGGFDCYVLDSIRYQNDQALEILEDSKLACMENDTFKHTPVTTLTELFSLNDDEMLAGYITTKKGDPEPGANHSRSFHHGWRTKMMDLGEIEIPDAHRRLVHELALEHIANKTKG